MEFNLQWELDRELGNSDCVSSEELCNRHLDAIKKLVASIQLREALRNGELPHLCKEPFPFIDVLAEFRVATLPSDLRVEMLP